MLCTLTISLLQLLALNCNWRSSPSPAVVTSSTPAPPSPSCSLARFGSSPVLTTDRTSAFNNKIIVMNKGKEC